MNVTKPIFHHGLLKVLDSNRTRFGLQAAALAVRLRGLSIEATEAEITDGLAYLCGRRPALAEETWPEINRELRAWRITAEGIRYADEHNL